MGTRVCLNAYLDHCYVIRVYNHACLYSSEAALQEEGEVKQEEGDTSEVLDSRGISGWDKVEQLVRPLLSLKWLSISKEQAKNVSSLCDQLDSYNKKPLVFTKHRAKGRFARSRM